MRNFPCRLLAILIAMGFWLGSSLYAQEKTGVGVRGGFGVDPTQLFIGGQYETRPLADNLTFRPNVEFGFAEFSNLIALNAEVLYYLPFTQDEWNFYAGAGPALNIFSIDVDTDDTGGAFEFEDTDALGGFNIVGGAARSNGFFGEVKIGTWDSPDWRFMVGYTF